MLIIWLKAGLLKHSYAYCDSYFAFYPAAIVLEMKGLCQVWLEAFVKSTSFTQSFVELINVYQSSYGEGNRILLFCWSFKKLKIGKGCLKVS